MSNRPLHFRCNECGWSGTEDQIDRVQDPKPSSQAEWNICPNCRGAECFVNTCDEPGCDKPAGCGFQTPDGYRRTCFEHSFFAGSQGDSLP